MGNEGNLKSQFVDTATSQRENQLESEETKERSPNARFERPRSGHVERLNSLAEPRNRIPRYQFLIFLSI